MSIDLTDFRDEAVSSIKVSGELEKDILDINGRRIKFVEPIKFNGEIYKVGRDKLIHVDIQYKYEEACGRCLEPFLKEGNTILTGKLVEEMDEVTEDEEESIYYVDEELDLDDNILSMVILSLPMKPLCDENCKGLCPKCGSNHNQSKCDCIVEDIDPRFAKLKDFFPKK